MDTKERDLVQKFGISRDEFKEIRASIGKEHDLGTLWYREDSKKPEHLRTVYWTDNGLLYLRYYMEVKRQMTDIVDTVSEWKPMTKGEFDKSVNNTYWAGKVVVNNYKNNTCLMVEHQTGFKVLTKCRDSRQYAKHSHVVVDSKNLSHTVRLPSFKSYEKANEQALKANRKSK
jgi:hypothetical protein